MKVQSSNPSIWRWWHEHIKKEKKKAQTQKSKTLPALHPLQHQFQPHLLHPISIYLFPVTAPSPTPLAAPISKNPLASPVPVSYFIPAPASLTPPCRVKWSVPVSGSRVCSVQFNLAQLGSAGLLQRYELTVWLLSERDSSTREVRADGHHVTRYGEQWKVRWERAKEEWSVGGETEVREARGEGREMRLPLVGWDRGRKERKKIEEREQAGGGGGVSSKGRASQVEQGKPDVYLSQQTKTREDTQGVI